MTPNPWTPRQIAMLRDLYPRPDAPGIDKLVKLLGHSKGSITDQAGKQKLRRHPDFVLRQLTENSHKGVAKSLLVRAGKIPKKTQSIERPPLDPWPAWARFDGPGQCIVPRQSYGRVPMRAPIVSGASTTAATVAES